MLFAEPDVARIATEGKADLWDKPLGSSAELTFTMPDGIGKDAGVILFLSIDDVDEAEEGDIVLNDTVAVAWPESGIGERKHDGSVMLDRKDLKEGANKLTFTFKSTLGGKTTGFAILTAEVLVYKNTADAEKMMHLPRGAAAW